ncbi:MAG: transposase domain-containing protein, partial [Shimia sp.]
PDGTVARPQIVAFQDLYSGKLLSWRVDYTPNAAMAMSAFGEMVELWGIPRRCLFDNGREFASKWLTGGAPTRYRFKVREDEALGILPLLGIEMVWARPGAGQSKPIERAFRDLASDVAKDVRFAGAYVGNRPDAKPENYGERAVDLAEFLEVLGQGIDAHNAREGRESPTCRGRSFDAVFAESYARAPIVKATEEQRRLWLLAQQEIKVPTTQVRIKLYGNEYFADWLIAHAGAQVVARFDPTDLQAGLYVYDKSGAFLGFVECRQAVGFFDVDGARRHAAARARTRKATKALADAHRPIPTKDLSAMIAEDAAEAASGDVPAVPEAKVVRMPDRRRDHPLRAAPPAPQPDAELEEMREAQVVAMRRGPAPAVVEDTPGDRFLRALDIEARSGRGDVVGADEARWADGYRDSAEYAAQLGLYRQFGRDGIR